MSISKEQLERLKRLHAIGKRSCERMGARLATEIDVELLEMNLEKQQKPQKVELDQQTIKDIQEQVKKAIDNALKDLLK